MSKPLLILSAPVETISGYGQHARDIFASLHKMDRFDIKILSQPWGNCPRNACDGTRPIHEEIKKCIIPNNGQLPRQPDVWMQITVPNEFQAVGKYNIGVTAGIETTVCAPEWIEGMNRMNMVIVPSKFSKEVFDATHYDIMNDQTKTKTGELKCNIPIEVIFEGADLSIYNETNNILPSVRFELNEIKEDFCFLFVGHWLKGNPGHDRKDVGMLIKVFLETFKNSPTPPALILKTSGATFSIMDREELLNRIRQLKSSVIPHTVTDPNSSQPTGVQFPLPNIYILHGNLTDEEMNALYNHGKVKAHVSFTKGEGFGRPLLEASLSGKPMITSNWSGPVDFLHKDYNMLIGGKLQPVDESAVWDKVILKESQWFYIDYNQAASAMFNVFRDYKGAKVMCARQKEYAKQNFSLEHMHEVFKQVFDKHVPEFAQEIQLKLPKLKKISLPTLTKATDISPTVLKEEIKILEEARDAFVDLRSGLESASKEAENDLSKMQSTGVFG